MSNWKRNSWDPIGIKMQIEPKRIVGRRITKKPSKMKPATPLPWNFIPETEYMPPQDAEFMAHACNAYPKLVALLEDIRISGTAYAEHAVELLKELGEL